MFSFSQHWRCPFKRRSLCIGTELTVADVDWNDVRFFLALAREGSVRAAGSVVGASHSTVGRRVVALESELGVRLFDRHRDGFELTDAGRLMLVRAERMESEMCSLEREIAGKDQQLAGRVSITCCDHIVASLLLDGLAPLCANHRALELKFEVDSRSFDLSKREADIAIRILQVDTEPPQHLVGHRVAPVMSANYVAREHAARVESEDGGSPARWLSFEPRAIHEEMIATSNYPLRPAWGVFSSVELLAIAAKKGLGVAMLPTYGADRDPALIRMRHPDLRHVANFWLLSHPDLRTNTRVRTVHEAIRTIFETNAGLFAGTEG